MATIKARIRQLISDFMGLKSGDNKIHKLVRFSASDQMYKKYWNRLQGISHLPDVKLPGFLGGTRNWCLETGSKLPALIRWRVVQCSG